MKLFNKKDYYVKSISKHVANTIVEQFHYLKRKCPIYKAYGLYNKQDCLVGVCVYGYPHSSKLLLTFGEEYKTQICELSRLWIDDNVPQNAASFLISNSLKLLDKSIVYSYADPKQDHIGYVYQASNWLYTGVSNNAYEYYIEGINTNKHVLSLTTGYSIGELREFWGDKLKTRKIPKKHRYLYLNCNKKLKNHLLSILKYPILPYPK